MKSLYIDDYSIDEDNGTVDVRDKLELTKGADNKWALAGLPASEQLDESKVNTMASALSRITITGVRPKPESISHDLRSNASMQIDPLVRMGLQSKGFFITRDGRLLSNEGEVRVGTQDGVVYTLRFGEILFGEGLDVSAGADEAKPGAESNPAKKTEGGTENRYLFVTAAFDETRLPPKPTPPEGYQPTTSSAPASAPAEGGRDAAAKAAAEQYEKSLKDWEDKAAKGRKKAEELNNRFAPWYYVISASDFKSIRLDRSKLIKAPTTQEKD